jgi:CRISPR/Cas system type I-B associated protein Csh2 (Cas7 group RAMP superfamily)
MTEQSSDRKLEQHEVGDYFLYVLSGFASAAHKGTTGVTEYDNNVEQARDYITSVIAENNLKVSKKDIDKLFKTGRNIVELKEKYGK